MHDAKDIAVQVGKASLDQANRDTVARGAQAAPPCRNLQGDLACLSVDTHRTNGSFTFAAPRGLSARNLMFCEQNKQRSPVMKFVAPVRSCAFVLLVLWRLFAPGRLQHNR